MTDLTHSSAILIGSRPGFFARMQLRSPLLDLLRQSGHRQVVLWPIPDDASLRQELDGKEGGHEIAIERLYTTRNVGRVSRLIEELFISTRSFVYPGNKALVPPQTRRFHRVRYAVRSGSWLERLRLGFIAAALALLNRSRLSRAGLLTLEGLIARTHFYGELFRQYQPAAVMVATGGQCGWAEDSYLIREARRAGIPSVYMVMSWDNPSTKGMMGAIPDYCLVWTEEMKRELIDLHGVDPARIRVTGTPMVDAYIEARSRDHKRELTARYGLDPARKTVLIGTMSPATYPYNADIVEILVRAFVQSRFVQPVQIIIRPHPINFRQGKTHPDVDRMRELMRQSPHIHMSLPQMAAADRLDLPWSEMEEMITLINGSDVVVNLFSTMQVEAALADKPIVNVAFDPGPIQPQHHSLTEIAVYPHIARIIRTGGVRLADSEQALIDQINEYLLNPALDQAGRTALVHQECGPVDGQSANRIARFILDVAERQATGSALSPFTLSGAVHQPEK